jgi:polyferredoxin
VLTVLPILVLLHLRSRRKASADRPSRRNRNLLELLPPLRWLIGASWFPFVPALVMAAILVVIVVAGIFGTQMAGRNFATMAVWALWLPLIVLLLVPLGGRAWCTICPLPLPGEWLQRRTLVGPPSRPSRRIQRGFAVLRWPRALANAWPRLLIYLLMVSLATAFATSPRTTAWMLVILILVATATAAFHQPRVFCRYLCPINAYLELYSIAGKTVLEAADGQECAECVSDACREGSQAGWGCPYELFVPEMEHPNACGLCMECFITCPRQNVGLYWRKGLARGRLRGVSEAFLALGLFTLAAVDNVVQMGPWHQIRDTIDVVDRGNWGNLALYALIIWVICLGVVPGIVWLLAQLGARATGSDTSPREAFVLSAAAFVPIGAALWMAFAISVFSTLFTFVLQTVPNPLGWGGDALGQAGLPWRLLFPELLPWAQGLVVPVGLILSWRMLYNAWLKRARSARAALGATIPLAAFLWVASVVAVVFFTG